MTNQTLAIKTLFQPKDTVTFYHPGYGRIKGIVLSNEYLAQTGQTVCLKTAELGISYINERFLQRLVLVAV